MNVVLLYLVFSVSLFVAFILGYEVGFISAEKKTERPEPPDMLPPKEEKK